MFIPSSSIQSKPGGGIDELASLKIDVIDHCIASWLWNAHRGYWGFIKEFIRWKSFKSLVMRIILFIEIN